MKTCMKCGEVKHLAEFYKHKRMADGHLNKCKECAKKDSLAHRAENLDAVRAYDRERGSLQHRVQARAAYQETESGKAAHAAANGRYRNANRDRHAAHNAVAKALASGNLKRWPMCALPECNETKVEAHHPDYSRPLDVVWLCNRHHVDAHNLVRGK